MMTQVMEDAAGFTHPRRRHDNERIRQVIELLGLLRRSDVAQPLKTKGVALAAQVGARLIIEALGVRPEDLGGVDRHRAVHERGTTGICPASWRRCRE